MNISSATKKFHYIASEIIKATTRREALIQEAFETLESRYPSLSQALLVHVGNNRRASHWLCTPRSAWQGRTPCDLLADGDQDSIWDLLQGYDPTVVGHQSPA